MVPSLTIIIFTAVKCLTVPPALPRHNRDPATDSTPEYTSPDQSQSITEGGTGDSGFEEPFLKVPLRPKGNP